MPGRVLFGRRMRAAFARTALIKQDDPVQLRIKETARSRIRAGTGPAVKEYHRLALRVAAFLVIQLV